VRKQTPDFVFLVCRYKVSLRAKGKVSESKVNVPLQAKITILRLMHARIGTKPTNFFFQLKKILTYFPIQKTSMKK
jgi:hypothetical protein